MEGNKKPKLLFVRKKKTFCIESWNIKNPTGRSLNLLTSQTGGKN